MRTRPAPVDHHVGRLQVAVEDAAVVRGGQAGAELPRDSSALSAGRRPIRREQRRQVLAVDVLHRQELLAVGLADVVDAADVRVRDLARDPHLVVEPRQRARLVAAERAGRNLRATGWPSFRSSAR